MFNSQNACYAPFTLTLRVEAKQRALHETPLKVKCRARRISFVAPKIFKIG